MFHEIHHTQQLALGRLLPQYFILLFGILDEFGIKITKVTVVMGQTRNSAVFFAAEPDTMPGNIAPVRLILDIISR